ncbi:MAG TPA: hypothetical protein VGK48_05875 [Terriglobia bacterium]|jgi:hypothetical protein
MIFLGLLLQAGVGGAVPFAFFQPTVTVSVSQQAVLDRGDPVTQILPASGAEDAVFTAISASIDDGRLIAWVRRIDDLKKSKYVLTVRRFSDPPRIEDLSELKLDPDDIEDIQKCRAGNCQLKLSAAEMTQLREAARARSNASAAIEETFRRLILERVQLYLKSGHVPPYEDKHVPVHPEIRFDALLDHTAFLTTHVPELNGYFRSYPLKPVAGLESFFYWSKERVAGKAIISVTQVNIVRYQRTGVPDVLVVNRDIYSSHYIDASLSLTALTAASTENHNYLVYINRTDVDILHGVLETFIRKAMHHRIREGATDEIETYKQRMESGDPPPVEPANGASGELTARPTKRFIEFE